MKDVTETLEADYPESDVILCKDLACCLKNDYDRLPKGYVHTFLIRDPRRSISSLCKIHRQLNTPAHMFAPTGGVKQLYDLHNYVTNTLNQKSIIIDAGDLAKEPEKTIRKYCEAVEIPFSESYLNWKPNNIDHWHAIWKDTALKGFFFNAIRSTHFKTLHGRDQDQEMDISDVPHYGQLLIEDALPYYRELFEKRLRP
ncbi:uncharacterized protein [Ptychodera flava]|uniref:uncharacterized protein n=1 Tax=Ptychodera flava TaxID=63121 RepID=UPI00396A9572